MKAKCLSILIILMIFTSGLIFAQQGHDIFNRAKLYLFDKKWDMALKELNTLIQSFPETKLYPIALFYKAKCLEELKMPKKALSNFNNFLRISKNKSLREEANVTIIDLCFFLYQNKDRQYINKIINFLKAKEQTVQYYAAFKLSYAKDKKIAEKAVQILKKMISDENDPELIERAKIALMRINPRHLSSISKEKGYEKAILKIRVFNKKSRKETLSLNIPFVLAKLALDALPEKEKAILKKRGYNLDNIIQTLISTGEILRIEDKESLFKIWIE